MTNPRLLVIIGSTRPGRIGEPIAEWFAEQARKDGRFTVQLHDLKNLPFLDEPNHPRMAKYTQAHTITWSATVRSADAVVWVTPEYNYSIVAPMKNAIDSLFHEWRLVPTGFVSYGGASGGIRAVEHAKHPLSAVGTTLMQQTVSLPFATQQVKDGEFTPDEKATAAVEPLLDELLATHRRNAADRASALAAADLPVEPVEG